MCRYSERSIPEGFRIRVQYVTRLRKNSRAANKWLTIARLLDKTTNQCVSRAIAVCSEKDNPNRKIGRAIAVGRALKQYAYRDALGLYD